MQQPLLSIKREGDNPVLETDVIPYKTGTDLMVLASAHAPSPGTRKMVASIALGKSRWHYATFGDRRCSYRGKGAIASPSPGPFEKVHPPRELLWRRGRASVRSVEGKVHEIQPVPHRVLVSTDEMGVYVVWARRLAHAA